MLLTDFPPELLTKLFSYLDGANISTLSRVCKVFNQTSTVEEIWKTRCLEEYGVKNVNTSILSYQDAYKHVLHKWGCLLGTWNINLKHYGGLLHVQFTGCKIEATEYAVPHIGNLTGALRQKPVFSAESSPEGSSHSCVQCRHRRPIEPHPGQILKIDDSEPVVTKFRFRCCNSQLHRRTKDIYRGFEEWFKEEIGDDQTQFVFRELLFQKYKRSLNNQSDVDCSRLALPSPISHWPVPIQPGLFTGAYGGHGYELILLSYSDDRQRAQGLKIAGDPNIPAGQLTFRCDLTRPMILAHEQQTSIEVLGDIDTPDLPTDMSSADKLPPQPFVVPRGCHIEGEMPRRCLYRCHGQGQIAGDNYTSPSFIPGHWVVFDMDTFAFIWMEIRAINLFCRVKETFSIEKL